MTSRFLIAAIVGALGVSGTSHAEPSAKAGDDTPAAPFSNPSTKALADAACVGDRDGIRRSLASGALANGEGEAGVTPLLWALRCHSIDGVRALLDAGADPNKVVNGIPTVIFAARLEDVEFLTAFLEHGANPNASYEAVWSSPLDVALLHGINDRGWNHWDLLLRSGADVNLADHSRQTTAMKAARATRYDRVLELLEHGYSYNLPELRRIATSRIAIARTGDDPARLRVVSILNERIGQ